MRAVWFCMANPLWCRDAKPNKGELAILRQVMKLPPSKPLANHQKAQVSKFRYYLAKQSGTVIPFLKAVEWTSPQVCVMNSRRCPEASTPVYIFVALQRIVFSHRVAHTHGRDQCQVSVPIPSMNADQIPISSPQ